MQRRRHVAFYVFTHPLALRPSVRWPAHCTLLFSAGRPRGVSDFANMNFGRLEQFDEISRHRPKGLMGFDIAAVCNVSQPQFLLDKEHSEVRFRG